MRRTIRSAKRNGNVELPARHQEHVRRVVHHLIERYERETERHELDDRSQADHRRADPQPGETVFADRRVDDSSRPKPFQQTLADFVSAVIFGDFFAHEKNIWVALELFGERFVQRLTICDFSHSFAPLKYT